MKKSRNNAWKRVAAGALSMALVAGIMPANVGGFLTGSKGIEAYAADPETPTLYAVQVRTDGEQTVSEYGTISYNAGDQIYTAAASEGYAFDHWGLKLDGADYRYYDNSLNVDTFSAFTLSDITAYFKDYEPVTYNSSDPVGLDRLHKGDTLAQGASISAVNGWELHINGGDAIDLAGLENHTWVLGAEDVYKVSYVSDSKVYLSTADKAELGALYYEAEKFYNARFTETQSNLGFVDSRDHLMYNAIDASRSRAKGVYTDGEATPEQITASIEEVTECITAAKRVINAREITAEGFLELADENDVITLTSDYFINADGSEEVGISGKTIDLNGHALLLGEKNLLVTNGTEATIKDSQGNGILKANYTVLSNYGTVNINGVKIIARAINNYGYSVEQNVVMNINGGEINLTGLILNAGNMAYLNISGGTMNCGINDEGPHISITGGSFKYPLNDEWLAAGYKKVAETTEPPYYTVVSKYTAETAITDGSEINLYAEDEQSYPATVTIIGSEEFTKDDALAWLGITIEPGNDSLFVKDKDDEDIIAEISLSGDDNATEDTTDNKYKLTLTFTAVPFYYTVGDSDAHIYNNTGSGTVKIGGINININVKKRTAVSDKAVLDLNGLTTLSFSYHDEKEGDVTENIPKRQFATYENGILIPAGATVTLTTQYKSEFSYSDGFTNEIAGLTETAGTNRAYTYSFTMPAYNVDHSFVEYSFTDNTLYDNDNNTSTDDVTSITERTEYDDNAVYYYGKDVTIKSANRLVFTDDNDKLIEFTETKNESDYTYTFKVTSDVTASLYEHKHDYTCKVEDNKLIRTCKLEDGFCEDGNSDQPIAELKLATPFDADTSAYTYDKTAKSVSLDGTLIEGVTVTAVEDTLSYYEADAFGDAVSDEKLDGAPSDAGKYLATQKVWYDIDEDTIKDEDEEFELSVNFEIKPKDINEVFFNVVNSDLDNGVYNLNGSNPNGYASPIVSLEYGEDVLAKGIGKDYVVTGTTTTTKFGKYTAAVSGVGNYTGTIEFDWRYGEADAETTELTSDMINVETVYRNGYAQANITVGDFTEGENYYVLGETAVNAGGTYKLKVVGINSAGLSGTAEVDWVVDEVQLSGKNADVKKVTYSADKKLEFRANMAVPEGATMTKIGVFATNNEEFKYKLNFTDTPKQTDDVFVKEYTDGLADKKTMSYIWRKSSIQPGATWYAVPYVCYTDKDGNAVTAYGDLIKATVDDSGKATYKKVEIGQAKLKSASYNATTKKLEFANRMIIPDGCTMNTIGICATNNQAKAADLSINTAAVNGETYIKAYTDDFEGKTASYTWRKTSVKAGDIWYVKPYVSYTDADGATYIAYGALETVTAGQEAAANAELS